MTSRLPTFIFIGPLKTATTWIYDYLSERGDVILPAGTKETLFFDRHYDKGLEHYSKFFRNNHDETEKICVEVAPSYGGNRQAIERMASDLPDVHLVLSLRDPVRRTVSQFKHERRYGYYDSDIQKYLTESDPIITRSRYPEIIKDILDVFREDQLSVIFFEELEKDPHRFCKRICSMLKIEYIAPSDALIGTKSNEASTPRSATMARAASAASDFLRKKNLHWLPTLAKRLGVRRFLESPAGQSVEVVTESDKAQIKKLLGFEYSQLSEDAKKHEPKL